MEIIILFFFSLISGAVLGITVGAVLSWPIEIILVIVSICLFYYLKKSSSDISDEFVVLFLLVGGIMFDICMFIGDILSVTNVISI